MRATFIVAVAVVALLGIAAGEVLELGEAVSMPLGDSAPGAEGTKSWCAGQRLKAVEDLGNLRNTLKVVNGKMLKERTARLKAEQQMTSLKTLVESGSSKACAGQVEVMRLKLVRAENAAALAATAAEGQLRWYKGQVKTLNAMQKRMQGHLVSKVTKGTPESEALAKVVLFGASSKKSTKAAAHVVDKFMKNMAAADKKAAAAGGAVHAEQLAALVAKNAQLQGQVNAGAASKGAKPAPKVAQKSAKKASAKAKKPVKAKAKRV
jgi:hypothetical protein